MQLCKCGRPRHDARTESEKDGGTESPTDGTSDFPRLNWGITILLQSLISVGYCIILPSMHQFITSTAVPFGKDDSSKQEGNATSSQDSVPLPPGLGMPESFYSWAVTMYSLGELLGALIAGCITQFVPYRHSILLSALLLAVGSLFYATTTQGWMVLIGRLCAGLNAGFGLVLVTAYLGETATEVMAEREKRGGKRDHSGGTLKDKLFLWYSFSQQASYPAALLITSAMAQLPNVDQYRWAAWLVLAVSSLYIVTFVATFKEKRPYRLPKCSECRSSKKKTKKSGNSNKNTQQKVKTTLLYAYIVVCSYVAGALYTILDTLLNPVLSDHFGFTIADTSYFILGITFVLVGATGIQYILNKLRMDNRKVFVLALLAAMFGGFIASDWQSIGSDPCSAVHLQELATRELPWPDKMVTSSLSSIVQQNTANYTTLQFRKACEAVSTPEDLCHWNPVSQFTGQYCQTCRPVCRSMRRSLNFFQFCIGVSLMTLAIPLGNIIIAVIASDFTPLESQGSMMGALFAAAGLGRMISPLWVDAVYEASGKHTYVPMTIMATMITVVVVLFILLYKHLAPRNQNSSETEFPVEMVAAIEYDTGKTEIRDKESPQDQRGVHV